jgi:hypothetical protein
VQRLSYTAYEPASVTEHFQFILFVAFRDRWKAQQFPLPLLEDVADEVVFM